MDDVEGLVTNKVVELGDAETREVELREVELREVESTFS